MHTEDDFDGQHEFSRVYIDQDATLVGQTDMFINVPIGTMHAKDLLLKAQDFILDLCRSRKDNQVFVQKAEEVLFRLLEEKRFVNNDTTRSAILLSGKLFETIIFGWGKVAERGPQGMERMGVILEQMKREHASDLALQLDQPGRKVLTLSDLDLYLEQVEHMGCQPKTQTFNTYLVGLQYAAKAFPYEVKDRASNLLDDMEFLGKMRGYPTLPNAKTYTQILTVLAKTKLRVDIDAMKVFKRMKNASRDALDEYNEKYETPYNFADPTTNKHQIVTPDCQTYTALLLAHTGNNADPDTIEKIIKEMLSIHNGSIRPDAVIFTAAIDAFAKSVRSQTNPRDRARLADKAEHFLWMLVDVAKLYKDDPVVALEEDAVVRDEEDSMDMFVQEGSENQAGNSDLDEDDASDDITGWDANESTGLKLTAAPFNAAINAWAQSDVKESAERAQDILDRMLREQIVKPDLTTFNTVMNAWSRAIHDETAPIKVAELLALMYDMVESKELHKSDRPDRVSFSTLIMAWAKSKDTSSASNARDVLNDQLQAFLAGDVSAKPGIISFTGVLTAAANSPPRIIGEDDFGAEQMPVSESTDPYRIAMTTYTDIVTDKYGLGLKPDHIVFSQMLSVISKHNDPRSTERQTMTRHVFDAAAAAGQCSSLVVRALIQACPSKDLLAIILKGVDLDTLDSINHLPKEWTRNVSRLPNHRTMKKERSGGGNGGKISGSHGKKGNSQSYDKKHGGGQNKQRENPNNRRSS
jgi:hypothetical protein